MAVEAAHHFVEKWQAREPEMVIAEVFCTPAHRQRFLAWGALLHALRESLFELSDARVADVKTAWWAEELGCLADGQRRHPLSEALVGIRAPWAGLSRGLLDQRGGHARAANAAQAIDLLMPLASAATAVEASLFDAEAGPAQARSLARHWLLQRMPHGLGQDDQALVPMHLLARHGVTASQLATEVGHSLLRDWGHELARSERGDLGHAAYFRRSRDRFDQARLERLAAGKGFTQASPPASLWSAWRAARSGS